MVAKIQKDDLAVVSSLRALNGSYHSFEYRDKFGFTTLLHADEDVHNGQTVKFTQVKSNFGSRYDANTGIFRSDRSELFIFFYGVECHGGNVGAELVRD
ncbi:uncharacterized protein LOC134246706 isoform X2 [Saccostrea cucullata]|uniref:uncharacterized protein LOC134243759 isoform X2 n=1 Tax=Saccostrea cuccullata TaxID=36930 RepID=UPI002ED10332